MNHGIDAISVTYPKSNSTQVYSVVHESLVLLSGG